MSSKVEKNISNIYASIQSILENSRKRVIQNVNFEMVQAYWKIDEIIVEEQKGKARAEYGKYLLKELSNKLTNEFGKGFDETNLRNMRGFYKAFPIRDAVRHELDVKLRTELSWTHYRYLLKVIKNIILKII